VEEGITGVYLALSSLLLRSKGGQLGGALESTKGDFILSY
jgi:hypothetical protein